MLFRIGMRSAYAWVALFLAPELAANAHLNRWQAALAMLAATAFAVAMWPFVTLSETVWNGEAFWPVVIPVFVAVFAFVLVVGHFELHWGVRWVLLTSLIGLVLIVSRIIHQEVHD